MYTVNTLIYELQQLSSTQKDLPIVGYDLEHNTELVISGIDETLENRVDIKLTY